MKINRRGVPAILAAAVMCAALTPAAAWADVPATESAPTTAQTTAETAAPTEVTSSPTETSTPTGSPTESTTPPSSDTGTPPSETSTAPPTTRPEKKTGVLVVWADDVQAGLMVPGAVIRFDAPRHHPGTVTTPAQVTLSEGYYRFTVVAPPAGYHLLEPADDFDGVIVAGRNLERRIRVAKDQQEPTNGVLGVTKRDRVTGEPLQGAKFRVVTCSGNYVAALTSGDQGTAFRGLDPGCYDLLEDAAPAGYQLDLTPHRVWIKKGEETDLTVYDIPVDYVAPRNPADRVPLRSVPSGRID